ncbi:MULTISPECIES: helix-turn-helix domain-containing protein [unclassified Apibacter]|uniref:winged helix-turn-helix transcriptional regulator n=1 Tax=unclassified Apibacter TaxID=2630820 RepID=UPI0013260C31|nr:MULTISPECIES: helix-turn-helix domain-containing protein [unclassified Apibacter]MXO34868.1 transcriptional regulator [Apibacter sp. B3883]MXO42028.1 transcriptional regulator [Apibacter sp. B3889]MXP03598.1 transcriptional regulator [Apibacter sp. B3887]MXP08166.1 transcriptional regulator [Apibacter sp. B3935]QYN50314.1 helix-turn-helix transcriptional regulator [Apibacter sp. ESL0404]
MSSYKRKIPIDISCGINVALKVIGSKWKLCIIELINKGISRPRDLNKRIANINKRVLQQQLKELETDGLISKTIYPEVPLRAEYSLTELGITIIPLLKQIEDWGNLYTNLFEIKQN